MKSEDLERYRRALQAKRGERNRGNIEGIVIERVADAADESVLASQRDLAVDTLNRETAVARQVDKALERIEAGTYGLCARCGDTISSRRLEALPWAELCIACQDAVDGMGRAKTHSRFSDAA